MSLIVYPDNKYICEINDCVLLVVDTQMRLVNVMHNSERDSLVTNICILLKAASILNMTTMVTEQYPAGLGNTVESLNECCNPSVQKFEKTGFSCLSNSELKQKLTGIGNRQVVLCGIETHVCILQTACDLIALDIDVFLVEDATSSRKLANKINALNRLRQIGVTITNTESVLFELLRDAKHEHFKQISALIK